MASLKEVKSRISSVKNTQQITQAMKMVASAKLHRAQSTVEQIRKYQNGLEALLSKLTSYGIDTEPEQEEDHHKESPYMRVPKGKDRNKVAIVAISSNSGMCGAFNANIIREANRVIESYGDSDIVLLPIGKKIRSAFIKQGYTVSESRDHMADKLTVEDADALSSHLATLFVSKEVREVIVIYHRFESMAAQRITTQVLLPFTPTLPTNLTAAEKPLLCYTPREETADNYIFEPDRKEIIKQLTPKVFGLRVRVAILDAFASEHGARTVAMQIASDNANDLLEELHMQYNKLRQEGITTELLDIIGGSFA